MLILDGIKKSFAEQTVLDGVSLRIREGERFVLLGPSGCGKTTLLRLIAGFDTPDNGKVTIANQDMSPVAVEKRPVGFIFQRHALFPHMNVYDNIAVGPRVIKTPENEIEPRIEELLGTLRLSAKRAAWPGQLSGGESQRVALARALINRPRVLLLDEPLSAVDENLRQSLRDELRDIQKTFGITFLFVTHDREEALTLAHRIGILHRGKLLQAGTPQELFEKPASSFVVRFLGGYNRFEGTVVEKIGAGAVVKTVEGNRLQVENASRFAVGNECEVYVRPHHIAIGGPSEFTHPPNIWIGQVKQCTPMASRITYKVQTLSGKVLNIESARTSLEAGLQEGRQVRLTLDGRYAHVFPRKNDD